MKQNLQVSQKGGLYINETFLDSCHLGVLPWIAILLNLYGIAVFEQMINVLFTIQSYNNVCSIHNCLLYKNPGNESPLVAKHETFNI